MANASVLEVPATETSAIVRSAGNNTTFPIKGVSKEELKTATEVNTALQLEAEAKVATVIKRLAAAWTGAVGKTVDGTLSSASTVAEAKAELNPLSFVVNSYEKFVHEVCRISVRTADKYIMIDDAFGKTGLLNKFKDQLPPDWTKLYQLSRFCAADKFTPKKQENLFLKALDFITTPQDKTKPNSFPTEIEINTFVNDLLNIEPKTKLVRPETTNGVAVEVKAGKTEDGKTEYAVPDANTGASISRAASMPLGESPTPEQTEAEIEAAQDDLFADDGNEVLTESLITAYDTLRLRNKIKALLHEENLTNLEVIVRQKAAA